MKINTTTIISNIVISMFVGFGNYYFGNLLGISFPLKLMCSLAFSSLVGMLLLSFELNMEDKKNERTSS